MVRQFSGSRLESDLNKQGIVDRVFTPKWLASMTIQELLSLRMIGLSEQEELDVMAEFEKPHRKKQLLALDN